MTATTAPVHLSSAMGAHASQEADTVNAASHAAIASAADLFDDSPLIQRFAALFARIAERTVAREQGRELAFEEVDWLRQAGFTKLRIPKRYGGDGITLFEYFALVTRLGEADSNLPQILRVHGGFIESLIKGDDEALRDRWFARIVAGDIIGGAVSERTAQTNNSVRVSRDGDHWRVDGEKFYTTGSLYADWIDLAANDGESDVRVLIDANSPGVSRIDDWDGFGQRLTGSGTTRFNSVAVPEDQLYRRFDAKEARRNTLATAFYQVVHLANLAGITRAVLRDAVTFTQGRSRTFGIAGESRPRDNPLVQRVVGRLASLAYSTQSISDAIARALSDTAIARDAGQTDTGTYIKLDIQAFQAQQIVLQQTLEAATLLFEVGGASATSETRRFDRHWRNARVLASHNPAVLREAAIGRFYLNGEANDERFGLGLK